MSKRTRLLSVATVLLTMVGAMGATDDYLRDPAFSTGTAGTTPVGWEKYIGSDDFECILDATAAQSAPFAMKCAGYTDKSGGGAHFVLRRMPLGTPVTISAWVKVERYSGRAQFALETVNFNPTYNQLQWVDIANVSTSTGWTRVSKTITVDPAATSIFLTVFLKSNVRIWVDDIEIVPASSSPAAAVVPLLQPGVQALEYVHRASSAPVALLTGRVVTSAGGDACTRAPGVYVSRATAPRCYAVTR